MILDENPQLCPDYGCRKKLYYLLVRGGCISVMEESKGRKAYGDKLIETAKAMIIERNRECVASKCCNIDACTSAIEEESPLKLPKGFLSLNRPYNPSYSLVGAAIDMMKRAFGKA